jgi:hypothetical protein
VSRIVNSYAWAKSKPEISIHANVDVPHVANMAFIKWKVAADNQIEKQASTLATIAVFDLS